MREESLSTVSKLPADVLWEYLADYDKVVRLGWDDASARRLDDPGDCVARYRVHTTWEGMRSTYTARLESADRPRSLTWTTKSGGARSWVRFDLQPMDSSDTTVTVTMNVNHGPALRLLEPFAWGLLRPALVKTVSRLEHLDEEVGQS